MHNIIQMFPSCLSGFNQHKEHYHGSFRLLGCVAKVSRLGKPYRSIKVADISGIQEVVCFDDMPNEETFKVNGIVMLALSYHSDVEWIVAKHPEQLIMSDVMLDPALFWKALPVNWIIAEDVVERFLKLLMSMQSGMLLAFITKVFWQSDVLHAFLTAPASFNDHHHYQGGVLEHSVETAEIAAALPLRSAYERDLLITAALLHDIGQAMMLSQTIHHSSSEQRMDSVEKTLELCAPALRWLGGEDAATANMLRRLWTSRHDEDRDEYHTDLASTLRLADQMSLQLAKRA